MLQDDREQYKLGKLVSKATSKSKKSKDIDDIIGSMSKAEMENLSALEKEQLLDMQLEKYGVDAFKGNQDDIDEILRNLTPEEIKGLTQADIDMLLDMEADKLYREGKADGGMLTDDREQYKLGKLVSKVMGKSKQAIEELPDVVRDTKDAITFKLKGDMSLGEKIKLTEDMYKDSLRTYTDLNNSLKKATNIDEEDNIREMMDNENEIIRRLTRQLKQMGVEPSMKNFREERKIPRGGKAEGGMLEQSEPMESDEVMEDNYLEFVLDEALTPEEQSFLTQELEQNMQLAMIFDKVVDVAQEFAGSGPVEGPGSGVSDSIPARLSDGEFVFTAKAVEEIGADNLMAMMKDAEMKADGRQDLAEGGQPEEDTVEMEVEKPATKQDIRVVKTTVDNGGKGLLDEDEIAKSIKSKMMLDNRTGRHVQS